MIGSAVLVLTGFGERATGVGYGFQLRLDVAEHFCPWGLAGLKSASYHIRFGGEGHAAK